MFERSWSLVVFAALWLAFALVALAVGLGYRRLLPAKLRIGGLLLAVSAVAVAGCGEPEPMCYAAPYEGDTDSDTDADSDTDSDADADTDTDTDR
jgi:hypothetical protein